MCNVHIYTYQKNKKFHPDTYWYVLPVVLCRLIMYWYITQYLKC